MLSATHLLTRNGATSSRRSVSSTQSVSRVGHSEEAHKTPFIGGRTGVAPLRRTTLASSALNPLRLQRSSVLSNSYHSTSNASTPPRAKASSSEPIPSDQVPKKRTLLIDASPFIFRAFHSIPVLGGDQPLNAVYGFLRTLLKLLRENPSDYVAVCMDGDKSFRKEMQPTYKAQRAQTPDDLKSQFPIVSEAVQALGIACIRVSGYEADDLLATYAKMASDAGHEVLVVSPDKDALQLVSPSVLVTTATGPVHAKLDALAVSKKFGVLPELVPHLQALIGDPVDNIPKVRGLTESAAKNIVKHFGSVHKALENIDEITVMAQRDALRLHADSIKNSYELALLRTDAPVGGLDQLLFNGIDEQGSIAFCSKYKLRSIRMSLDKEWFSKNKATTSSEKASEGSKTTKAAAKKTSTPVSDGKDALEPEGETKKVSAKTTKAAKSDSDFKSKENDSTKYGTSESTSLNSKSSTTAPQREEIPVYTGNARPFTSMAAARGAKERLNRITEEASRNPSPMSYEEAVSLDERQYELEAEEILSMSKPQTTNATEEPKTVPTAKKTSSTTNETLTQTEKVVAKTDESEVAKVAPPPIPRARKKRTSTTISLSTDGHVSEEIDIDTDPVVVESTKTYKESRKRKEKVSAPALPPPSLSESSTSSNATTINSNASSSPIETPEKSNDTAESILLQNVQTEHPAVPLDGPIAPLEEGIASSTFNATISTTAASKSTKAKVAPTLNSSQTSQYHTSTAPNAKRVADDSVLPFLEALKKNSQNPDQIDAALQQSKTSSASPGSLFSPATRQRKIVASVPSSSSSTISSDSQGTFDAGQTDGSGAEPKKRGRKPKMVILDDPSQLGVFPASKLESSQSSVSDTANKSSIGVADASPLASKISSVSAKRKNPVNGPGTKTAEVASGASKMAKAAKSNNGEPEEDDEESNLELVDYIKNRTMEVDVEFVNLFQHCSTPVERRRVIESKLKGVTVANDAESAKRVLDKLMTLTDRFHGCDCETIDINVKKQGPVGNGQVICASIYVGPDIDFGNGPRVWIDNLDDDSTLQIFKPYFESEKILKVWHNYGFDRHIFYNHHINVKGFGGDTMHMARLWDSSRRGAKAYSLEVLSRDLLLSDKEKDEAIVAKTSMKQRFGRVKLKKDGTPSKSAIILPALDEIQRDAEWLPEWIDYATLDAEDTWRLREVLAARLSAMNWVGKQTMYDFYQQMWLPFGELLTDMERRGIKVDKQYLKDLVPIAEKEKAIGEKRFIDWATTHVSEECRFMNPGSDAQKQQLLFAPCTNKLDPSKEMPASREFEAENTEGYIEEGKKVAKKKRSFTITGLGLPFIDATDSGWPAVSHPVLTKLVGDPPEKYGSLVGMFEQKGLDGGREACEALASALESGKIDTLISTFMIPLAEFADSNSRIHGSLNINTETGRLSSRRPNLQNQPAHEKDRFKIRRAFTCEPGNNLIVADYGQLELRLLAHMTNCKSMIDAFRSGGDFHSRTALGMYSHVKQAIDDGTVLLEWDGSKGKAPLPLLKDEFGTERRRAKTLNFSIAYGKTVMGLAKDWSVTPEEARDTLDKWYADRPEVKIWQEKTIARAHVTGWTRTLLGRYRPLPEINSRDRTRRTHSERAAINTPLQGGAADITTKAMILLHQNERLKQLGWHQLLQIHDELILEGPEESTEEALDIVTRVMSNPLPEPLLIDLVVDAKSAKTWYEAK